jgi:voltage-gated potassium channel Kch
MVIYLNLAIMFALLHGWLAFSIPDAYTNLPKNHVETPGAMIYFSLATLTTTGYGDIVPIHPFARSLATLESVLGQFYLAVFIGTLIGQHVAHRQRKNEGH